MDEQPTNDNNSKIQFSISKRTLKIIGISVAVLIILIIIIINISSNGSPSNHDLQAMIPDDILNYHIGTNSTAYITSVTNTKGISSIKSLNIEREKYNKESRTDEAECKIELTDDKLDRTEYITLYSQYYDKGGWQLTDYKQYKEQEFELKYMPYTEKMITEYLNGMKYTNFTLKINGAECTIIRPDKEEPLIIDCDSSSYFPREYVCDIDSPKE